MKKNVVTISIILIVVCCMLGIKAYGINKRERNAMNEAPVKKESSVKSAGSVKKDVTSYSDPISCKECHEDEYASYKNNLHGMQGDPRTPAAKQSCDTCHGPSEIHVKAEGKKLGDIITFGPRSKTPANKQNATCLQCHSTMRKIHLWVGSSHETRGLSCTNCHSNHSGNPKNLAKPTQTEVCIQCHQQVKMEIQKSSHHPVREGKMQCTDCHNPHGTVADKLIAAETINQKCYECHTEKRGPFLWEHAPVTENCLTCHKPHGSSHDKLLAGKRSWICQNCHSNSRHPGTLYAMSTGQEEASIYNVLNNREFNRSCQNCHSQIHGSNHPSGKALNR